MSAGGFTWYRTGTGAGEKLILPSRRLGEKNRHGCGTGYEEKEGGLQQRRAEVRNGDHDGDGGYLCSCLLERFFFRTEVSPISGELGALESP